MERKNSFPPIVSENSRMLILGSLPSAESLRAGQYYAHPRNAFWRIIYALYDMEYDADYNRRCAFLLEHKLALWDVCGSAVRQGSADSSISDIQPNDIAGLLQEFPNINRIILNGRKAEQEFRRRFSSIDIPSFYVPSTSPALAALGFEGKPRKWRKIIASNYQ
jgi:hypoxanthine-DNA glycosylase